MAGGIFPKLSCGSELRRIDDVHVCRHACYLLVICLLILRTPSLQSFLATIQMFQESKMTSYTNMAASQSSGHSLGMQLVVNQPMPSRLVMGTGSMMIFPLPLWVILRTAHMSII